VVVHFICRGNIFRSRLAAAYAQSLASGHSGIVFRSSGIEAAENPFGPISPYTESLASKHQLEPFMAPAWVQTTQYLLDTSDVNVFMNDDIYDDARERFTIPQDTAEIWHIPDIRESSLDEHGIYNAITQAVEELLDSLPLPLQPQ
jgi:protein-tyrosine-phosphatase